MYIYIYVCIYLYSYTYIHAFIPIILAIIWILWALVKQGSVATALAEIIPDLIMDCTNTMSSSAQGGKEGKVLGLLTKTRPLAKLGCPRKKQVLAFCEIWPTCQLSFFRFFDFYALLLLSQLNFQYDASVGESNELLSSPKWTWGKGWARAAARR